MPETLMDLVFNYLTSRHQEVEFTDDVEKHVNALTNYELVSLISDVLLEKETR